MRRILVLGAGHSSPFLIQYLLEHAAELDASITVADLDADAAGRRVGEHERGRARQLDLRDRAATAELMAEHDLAINLLPPQLQPTVARLCVDHGCHMVSASYRSREIEDLSAEAEQRGLALLTEMGLDPGIDLMSAQQIIEEVQARGGVIERFLSYGGGLPEPSFDGNPLRYCVTWNPRNVVMAGEHGARYLKNGRFKLEPWHRVFNLTWPVEVPGVGTMDAYANRDSISYRAIHGIERVKTLVRGTLRYPGFCQAWNQLVQLGMPNEFLEIPRLGERTWAELTAMFLPARSGSAGPPGSEEVAQRAADALGLERQDPRLQTLEWLGIFSEEPIGIAG
ncbi:MAG: saccharopine dehydrogenase C-terminal domain-containing protein, partial [Acidobacteriota bacterium]